MTHLTRICRLIQPGFNPVSTIKTVVEIILYKTIYTSEPLMTV